VKSAGGGGVKTIAAHGTGLTCIKRPVRCPSSQPLFSFWRDFCTPLLRATEFLTVFLKSPT